MAPPQRSAIRPDRERVARHVDRGRDPARNVRATHRFEHRWLVDIRWRCAPGVSSKPGKSSKYARSPDMVGCPWVSRPPGFAEPSGGRACVAHPVRVDVEWPGRALDHLFGDDDLFDAFE